MVGATAMAAPEPTMDASAQTSVLKQPLLTCCSMIRVYIKVILMGSTRVVRACSRFDYPVVRSTTRAADRMETPCSLRTVSVIRVYSVQGSYDSTATGVQR